MGWCRESNSWYTPMTRGSGVMWTGGRIGGQTPGLRDLQALDKLDPARYGAEPVPTAVRAAPSGSRVAASFSSTIGVTGTRKSEVPQSRADSPLIQSPRQPVPLADAVPGPGVPR